MVGRSKVWRLSHFANADRTEVQCDVCPTKIKFVGNTTNIARHLELKHPVEFASLATTPQNHNQNCATSPESTVYNSLSRMEDERKSKADENLAIRRILQIHNHELQKLKAKHEEKSISSEFIGPHDMVDAKNLLWLWHSPVNDGEERNVDLPSLVGGMNESSMGLLDNDTTEDQPLPPSPEQFLTEAEDSGNINSPNINQRPESYKLRHNNHLHLVLESLADDESFMDVTLTAQGKLIKAHKSVLSAVSPYFKGVLKQNPCQHPIIIMPRDIKFEELSSIIGYIYRGEITIAVEELPSLLKTAEILQVSGLSTSEASAVGGLAAHLLSRVQSSNLPFANHSSFKPKAQRKPKSFSKTKKELSNPDPELLNPVDFLNQDMSFIKEEITTEYEANPMTDDDECHAPMDSNDNEEASGSGSIPSTKLKDNNDSPPDTKIDSSPSSTLSSQLPYQCPHCFEIKRPLSVLETHMFTKHPSKPCFICKKCYKVFVRQSLFQTHSKICD